MTTKRDIQDLGRATEGIEGLPLGAEEDLTLDDPALTDDIEQIWLAINQELLREAADRHVPWPTRATNLAMVDENLDVLFGEHISQLKRQMAVGIRGPGLGDRSPPRQLAAALAAARAIQAEQQHLFGRLLTDLTDQGIRIVATEQLDAKTRRRLRSYFHAQLFPILTPLALNPALPFPHIADLSLNLLVALRYPDEGETHLARIRVPTAQGSLRRLIRDDEAQTFVTLEGLIADNLDLLFPGMEIRSSALFRVTRETPIEMPTEPGTETEPLECRLARAVRLEVQTGMSPIERGMLAAELGLNHQQEVFEVPVMMALRDLLELTRSETPKPAGGDGDGRLSGEYQTP